MKLLYVLFLFFSLVGHGFSASVTDRNDREGREIAMAENAIFSSLLVGRSRGGRYLCTQSPYACIAPNAAELGLALIAAKNSEASLNSLITIMRYRIDASASEDHTCYVLEKGKMIASRLYTLNVEQMVSHCTSELLQAKRVYKGLFDDVEPQAICSDRATIMEEIQSLQDAINSGRRCHSDDF